MSAPERGNEFDLLRSAGMRAGNTGSGGSCPDESVWLEIAAGIADEKLERSSVAHAAECDRCAMALKQAIALMAEPEEADDPMVLAAARKPRFLREAVKPVPEFEPSPKRRWWLGWPAVAAVAAVVAFVALIPVYRLREAEKLMARAEARGRTSEFRFSAAPYASVRDGVRAGKPDSAAGKGSGGSCLENAPASDPRLMAAADAAARAGESVRARLARARVALAQGCLPPDGAGAFEEAAREGPASAASLNDLGAALATMAGLQRDEQMRKQMLESALDAVSRALGTDPRHAAALYNKTLILQRLGRQPEACAALTKFLAVETDASWQAEGKNKTICAP